MKLTKTYRGKKEELPSLTLKEWNRGVSLVTNSDCRNSKFEVTISPFDYLPIAKKILKELSEISGVEYRMFVRVQKGSDWKSL